jgi:hypothetical protein
MASPPRISSPSALNEAETRFDRPLMLSWEEQRKLISLRDSPKKYPIPASPMSMKARMSAFAATSISSPPFVNKPSFLVKTFQPKEAIPAPPLADFPSSGDALAETTVSPALTVDANMPSHAAPTTNEDDCCREDSFVSTSVISHMSNDSASVEETCNVGEAGETVQAISCESFDDEDSDTDSHDSQLAESFEPPEVYPEDDTPETRFDRPLSLSWEEQRKLISLRDSPKKILIPASPMSMKARMSAFAATSISSPPFAKKPPFVKKAFQPKRAFLSPPLADFTSSGDALAETTVSPVSVADVISVCDASTTSHTVPITLEDDSFCEDKSSRALVISDSLSDTLVTEKTCNYGYSWACLSFDDDDSDTDSHDSQLADSFELPEVYQEDGSKAKSCGKAGKSKKGRFGSDSDSDDAAGTKPKKEKVWRTFEREEAHKKKGKPGKCKKGRFDSDSDSDDGASNKPKKEKVWRTFEKEQAHKKKEEEEKNKARFDTELSGYLVEHLGKSAKVHLDLKDLEISEPYMRYILEILRKPTEKLRHSRRVLV